MKVDGEEPEEYPHRLFDDMCIDHDVDIKAYRLWARDNVDLGSDLDNFAEFMARRFPHHKPYRTDDGEWEADRYVEEWADRFQTGKPHRYMGSESLVAYNEATNMLKTADMIRDSYNEVLSDE
jgi:hypothetical protein